MPISQFKKNVLVEEVLIQAALAMEHFDAAETRLADEEFRQSRLVWAHIQGFLAHAAMISKMLASRESPLQPRAVHRNCAPHFKSTLNPPFSIAMPATTSSIWMSG